MLGVVVFVSDTSKRRFLGYVISVLRVCGAHGTVISGLFVASSVCGDKLGATPEGHWAEFGPTSCRFRSIFPAARVKNARRDARKSGRCWGGALKMVNDDGGEKW